VIASQGGLCFKEFAPTFALKQNAQSQFSNERESLK
jgi:hypothetical protein